MPWPSHTARQGRWETVNRGGRSCVIAALVPISSDGRAMERSGDLNAENRNDLVTSALHLRVCLA
eukprot:10523886-Prorocentrum_lima.AAC.1